MNYSIILFIIGWILKFQAVFMVLPGITAVIYQESSGFAFLISMAVCLLIGIPLTLKKPGNKVFTQRKVSLPLL